MSIDLDWTKLDASFASSLINVLNRQLCNTPRPSFIGPIEITSFDFGSQPPDIELVDLRDIYRDFLEDDEGNIDAEKDPVRSVGGQGPDDEADEFEWVSRRSGMAEETPMYYHHLPPHVRYAPGPASDVFPSPSPSVGPPLGGSPPGSVWNAGMRLPTLGALPRQPVAATAHSEHPRTYSLSASAPASAAAAPPSSWKSFPSMQSHYSPLDSTRPKAAAPSSSLPPSPSSFPLHPGLAEIAMDPPPLSMMAAAQDEPMAAPLQPPLAPPAAPMPEDEEHPNLQLHLFVSWHSDLRLTLTTSLRINYPSPLFMSLPIRLSVTGLVFDGELAVAYEGGRCVHLCILDDLDPYCPSARRGSGSQGSTPSDPEGDDAYAAKPLPVGQRLLPEIFIESELGQADKHVLKNVTRVEKFIQDVIRKTIEEELVFPNFHTLVLR